MNRFRPQSPQKLAILLNLPTILFLLLIFAFPISYELYISMHKVGVKELRGGEVPFIGLDNFISTLNDPLFLKSIWNTVFFGSVSVVGSIAMGLGFALLMNQQKSWLGWITKIVILVPWAVTPIAGGVMWSFFYNPKYGYLNAAALKLGVTDTYINIIGDPSLAMWAVIIAYIWRVTPFAAIILYAALQTIPESVYEAAEVDGAGDWRKFISVTLPLLRPAIAVVLVLRTVFAFMVFDEVLAITHGGPGNETWTAVYYSYVTSFKYFEFGKGAASAFFITIIVAFLSVLYIRSIYTEIKY